ncbi:uncharacterized protein G2W53_027298 [Senna tora]|uniref:Uncharacterized protein n=1 Tax=Senna tora TaxID=362788 RepID=A0A834TGV4_9FABA|nr:uncharacterized protein G2W53_027298 [Senna tora]
MERKLTEAAITKETKATTPDLTNSKTRKKKSTEIRSSELTRTEETKATTPNLTNPKSKEGFGASEHPEDWEQTGSSLVRALLILTNSFEEGSVDLRYVLVGERGDASSVEVPAQEAAQEAERRQTVEEEEEKSPKNDDPLTAHESPVGEDPPLET